MSKCDLNILKDLQLHKLNNLQSIISRLSKISYTLLTINITITSIFISFAFSFNMLWWVRIIISILLLMSTVITYICNLQNLKNEKIFRFLYNESIKLNLENIIDHENVAYEILKIDFEKVKKQHKWCKKSVFSWLTLLWLIPLILDIVCIVITIIIK